MPYKRKVHPDKAQLKVILPVWLPPVQQLLKGTKLMPDRMKALLHNLFLCMLRENQRDDKGRMPWFNVHWRILQEVCPTQYTSYINHLERHGIIERRRNAVGGKSYLPGVYSQLYRFTPTQGSWGFIEDSISDYRTIKSVLSIRDKYQEVRYNEQTRQPLNTIHNELKKYVHTCKIDMTIAAKVVDTIYEPGDDVNRELDLRYLKAINDGDVFWFKVDAFGERCHHPYTNLKSEYRKGIRFQDYQDEALMQIDIKNSQPYFSSVLNEKIIDEILPEFAAVKPLIADLQLKPDYKLYCDLCRTGMIYEYMSELMGITRKEAKGQFFGAILFSNLRVAKKFQSMKYAFIDSFPSVNHFLTIIKKMDLNSFPEIAEVLGYVSTKKFSCAMQRLESRLIIQNVSARLIAGGIGPFITIHDSFIILPQDSSTVVKTIQDTFSDLNLPPPILSCDMLL